MSSIDSNDERASRISRIQAIVQEDFERIQLATDPFVVLNLAPDATVAEVRDRYERYERFYLAENFQRLGDMELTRRALHIRRAIGQAMAKISTRFTQAEQTPLPEWSNNTPAKPTPMVGADSAAMGDIYYRDGLTYLYLGDFAAACDHLQRSCDYDPSRGVVQAQLAYTRFKMDPMNQQIVEQCGETLRRAATLDPNHPEVFALLARFGINTRDKGLARSALKRLERLRPDHPRLRSLQKRAGIKKK